MFFLLGPVRGQYYSLSNKPQLTQKKHFYHAIIGENEFGVFTVNYTNDYYSGGFSIERYDRELGFQEDRVFSSPKRALILDIFLADSQIYWVSVVRKRRENLRLYLNKISVDFEGEVETVFLGHLPTKTWNPEDLKFSFSKQTGEWALALLSAVGEEKTAFWAEIRDIQGVRLNGFTDTLNERLAHTAMSQFSVGSSGELVGLVRVMHSRSVFSNYKREQRVFIFRGSSVENGFIEWPISQQLQSTELMYDRNLKRWFIAGLVGEGTRESSGYAILWITDGVSGFFNIEREFTHMQAKILDGEMRVKKRRNPMNYVLRRIIPQQDGGGVLLLERYIELKQLETFYINGIPQTATKVLYNYNEIGAAFFDTLGQIDTVLRINKEQTAAPATAYLLGFGSFVCETGVHLVYNDDISKNNEIKEVIIRPDYEIEEHPLLNSDNFYNVVVPVDGMESEYCTFTLPLLRDKQWFWMQVKNRD